MILLVLRFKTLNFAEVSISLTNNRTSGKTDDEVYAICIFQKRLKSQNTSKTGNEKWLRWRNLTQPQLSLVANTLYVQGTIVPTYTRVVQRYTKSHFEKLTTSIKTYESWNNRKCTFSKNPLVFSTSNPFFFSFRKRVKYTRHFSAMKWIQIELFRKTLSGYNYKSL